MSAELLENLAAQADAQALNHQQEAAPGAAPEAPEPAGPTNAQILAGAIAAGREVFCVVTKLEAPRHGLSDEHAAQLGALWAPVLEKHGIDMGKYLGDYALELAAAMGTFTIVVNLRKMVLYEIAMKERAAKPPPAAAPADIPPEAAANVG